MAPRLAVVMVNSVDAERLAPFWAQLLEVDVRGRWQQYVGLQPTVSGGARLVFQQIADRELGQRIHLDLHVPNLAPATARAEALGARRVRDVAMDGENWRIIADPEGNLFCLVVDPE